LAPPQLCPGNQQRNCTSVPDTYWALLGPRVGSFLNGQHEQPLQFEAVLGLDSWHRVELRMALDARPAWSLPRNRLSPRRRPTITSAKPLTLQVPRRRRYGRRTAGLRLDCSHHGSMAELNSALMDEVLSTSMARRKSEADATGPKACERAVRPPYIGAGIWIISLTSAAVSGRAMNLFLSASDSTRSSPRISSGHNVALGKY
jgi:hypothetical protein